MGEVSVWGMYTLHPDIIDVIIIYSLYLSLCILLFIVNYTVHRNTDTIVAGDQSSGGVYSMINQGVIYCCPGGLRQSTALLILIIKYKLFPTLTCMNLPLNTCMVGVRVMYLVYSSFVGVIR